jgi:hypothetical protein
MLLSDKHLRILHPVRSQEGEQGNILFMILMAIVLLAALTFAIEQGSSQQSGALSKQTSDNQINQMIIYASALGGALQQMATNGENTAALYNNLSLLQPGQAGFETAPSNLKLYHPLGGGITYQAQSAPTNAVATGYNINPNAIITGVGCSSGTGCIVTTVPATGHIVFGATISSVSYCEQINNILNGTSLTTVPPVMTTADFNLLFPATPPSTTTVTIGADCTPSCANIPRLCVSNTGATAWGFYADLFPPQYSSQ